MSSRCNGFQPYFQQIEPTIPVQTGHLEINPGSSPFEFNTQPVTPGTPIPPINRLPGSTVISPNPNANTPTPSNNLPGPNSNIPEANAVPNVTLVPQIINPVESSRVPYTQTPLIPNILPNAPTFRVPANPLLPPGYQEILSYDSLQYMNGFLRTQLGRICTVEFLLGSGQITTKTGRLIGIGLNYILLYVQETDTLLTCDYYSIRFVSFDDYQAGNNNVMETQPAQMMR